MITMMSIKALNHPKWVQKFSKAVNYMANIKNKKLAEWARWFSG